MDENKRDLIKNIIVFHKQMIVTVKNSEDNKKEERIKYCKEQIRFYTQLLKND